MSKGNNHPWLSGPREILNHGLMLMQADSETDRRIAMILIDNAVELMMKVFLGLPKRVTGLEISKNAYQEASESFPKLLDAMERYAQGRVKGTNLGEVEWYHRLRNELYHQGNGLTVEREKLIVYAEIAKSLFKSLYGVDAKVENPVVAEPLSQFLSAWARVEDAVLRLGRAKGLEISSHHKPTSQGTIARVMTLGRIRAISEDMIKEFNELREIRNKIVHARLGQDYKVSIQDIHRVDRLATCIEEIEVTNLRADKS